MLTLKLPHDSNVLEVLKSLLYPYKLDSTHPQGIEPILQKILLYEDESTPDEHISLEELIP